MSVTYLIEFNVRAGERGRFLRLLNDVLDAMRHEPTFEASSLCVDPEDEHRLLLHETWADHDDVVEVQMKRAYRDDWHAALESLLVRPRQISIWRPLRRD